MLQSTYIAENGESNLSMAQKILDAINWRIRIEGDGTINICRKARAVTESFDNLANDCIEPKVKASSEKKVYTGCLEEKYRDLWQSVLDAGCEIGTHTNRHLQIGSRDTLSIYGAIGHWQEALDKTLGYHYATRWLRPPYGTIEDTKRHSRGDSRVINAIKTAGYDHIVRWDVSEMKDLKKALEKTQNGSILLFHAKKADTAFLEKLIPELQARGFEMVTVSELFGFDPPETGGELFVYHQEEWKNK